MRRLFLWAIVYPTRCEKSVAVGLLFREFSGPKMGMGHERHRRSIEIALHDFLYRVLHSVTF